VKWSALPSPSIPNCKCDRLWQARRLRGNEAYHHGEAQTSGHKKMEKCGKCEVFQSILPAQQAAIYTKFPLESAPFK